MNKDELMDVAIEIVAYAGDARTKFLEAMNEASKGNFDLAEKLVEEGNKCIINAHGSQTELIFKEANGENVEPNVIFIHAQDHLMTTLVLKDLVKHMIELYRRG